MTAAQHTPTFSLGDDGTLDTVIVCDSCGVELRYNFANDTEGDGGSEAYDAFVAWAIDDAADSHECEPEPDDEPTEPQEDDITTSDHRTFYQNGKRVLACLQFRGATDHWYAYDTAEFGVPLGKFPNCEAAVRAYMERVQFWPNCWFISDHGNAHLMDLSVVEGGR